jgi:hypothetical protein
LLSGPKAVLAYLARYTHRVAISNRRLIAADEKSVTFTFKDYRIEGPGRYKSMTLATAEFIRRFLAHVLPKGFHRIRHYGLFASNVRAKTMRALIALSSLLPQMNVPPKSPSLQARRRSAAPNAAAACISSFVLKGHSGGAKRRPLQ